MRDLRIVFMGTPDFAVTILKKLVENNCTIVGVITAVDKPAGRGRKLNESAVKKYATSQGITILQPPNLKSPAFISELQALQANLQVVVAFRMLPKAVWNMPEYGTFNLHASLLPDYRGAAPIHWAIINGEQKTGVTTFFIDDKIDTGEIILQKECAIRPDETVGELHDTLMHLGADLVIETLVLIKSNKVQTIKQEVKVEKTASKLAFFLLRKSAKLASAVSDLFKIVDMLSMSCLFTFSFMGLKFFVGGEIADIMPNLLAFC